MTTLTLDSMSVPAPDPGPLDWNDEGVVRLPKLINDDLITDYLAAWWSENAERPGGWPDCTPYMRHPAIHRLVAPLAGHLEHLLGEPAGMHLNLTGLVTTTRDWHQDSYLNPPHVGDYYAAVWIALGDVPANSGPFQYIPGSHRWPQVTRELIGHHVDLNDPAWPSQSEEVLTPLFTNEIAQRGVEPVTYLPSAGDVLIWHGRLLHRGSVAETPGAYRPGFIAHFSGINHRRDMPKARQHEAGGWYFSLNGGPV